ncbi:proton myo-inositol cotransporter-like isoform X3 [Portunus trituberculatus]|uniref:proton myo-inositol cotransporter-like isoform X3 n=1 Tax=Portunus trituberculatus TaxID=210409 RepID=UPI001E1D066A|nr:proton myo-inositol cotransporter-like isoform X3 [Portunus trituberculatus]
MAEKSGINAHLVVTALLASICGFVSSYETIVFAACLLYIREELCLSTKWIQIVASIMYVTGILGNLAAGQVADLLGRKFVIMSSSVSHIIGALVVASSYTRTQVVVGRLFIGLSIGLSTMCVPIYLSEISVTAVRGSITLFYYFFYGVGFAVGPLVGGGFATVTKGWRYMAAIGSFMSLVQFIFFFFVPESPRWLISKGRMEEGKKALLSLRSEDYPSSTELDAIKADVNANAGKGGLVQIFKLPSVRRALLVGALLHMSQALTAFFTIIVYSATLVTMTGIADRTNAMWIMSGMVSATLAGLAVGLVLVERVGRRLLVLTSLLGITISFLFVAVVFTLTHVHSPAVVLPPVDPECDAQTCAECTFSGKCGFCFSGGLGNHEDAACVLANSADYYNGLDLCHGPSMVKFSPGGLAPCVSVSLILSTGRSASPSASSSSP